MRWRSCNRCWGAIFPELVWHFNEPFADPAAIPTYYIAKLARQHVTVVLSGEGGDENFAGYPRYARSGVFDSQGGFSPLLRGWLGDLLRWQAFVWQQRLWKDPETLSCLTPRWFANYARLTHFHELYQGHLYTADMKAVTAAYPAYQVMLDKYRSSAARVFLDALLNTDLELYLPETLMVKVDIASMVLRSAGQVGRQAGCKLGD